MPMHRKRYMKRLLRLLLLAGLLGGLDSPALGQAVGIDEARRILQGTMRSDSGISSLLVFVNFTALPEISSGDLVVDAVIGEPDAGLSSTRLAGGMTFDLESFPLYLEGNLGTARLDAEFLVNDPVVGPVGLDTDWTIYAASGGIGVDFAVSEHWVLRPILVAGLSHISNSTGFSGPGGDDVRAGLDGFLTNWNAQAGLYGRAAMAEYENLGDRYELNAKLRLTHVEVVTIDTPSSEFDARIGADTANLFARLGQPMPFRLFDRPLRWLLQGSGSVFLGDQRDVLGFSWFSSAGVGLEADLAGHNDYVSRARPAVSAVVGNRVSGYAIGLGVSF